MSDTQSKLSDPSRDQLLARINHLERRNRILALCIRQQYSKSPRAAHGIEVEGLDADMLEDGVMGVISCYIRRDCVDEKEEAILRTSIAPLEAIADLMVGCDGTHFRRLRTIALAILEDVVALKQGGN